MIRSHQARRSGATLVHLQAAIAIGVIVVAAISTSIAALYRLQTATRELQERSAASYRFEQQFRTDAREASGVESTDDGALRFRLEAEDVTYAVSEGKILRESNEEGAARRSLIFVPDGMQASLAYDEAAKIVAFTIEPGPSLGSESKAATTQHVRAVVGRPQLAGDRP